MVEIINTKRSLRRIQIANHAAYRSVVPGIMGRLVPYMTSRHLGICQTQSSLPKLLALEITSSHQPLNSLEPIDLKAGRLDIDGVDRDLGHELLLAFWNRQHHSGSVSDGDIACVDGMVFRRKAEDILYRTDTRLLTQSSVTTTQALLLMADELFSWCDERSLAWHYLGIAINMVIDLGIHTTHSMYYRNRTAESQEIGRRLFWSAYVADKVQSVYQGRPARLRDADCSVPILFLDEFEELEQFHSRTYSALPAQKDTPVRSVSTFEHSCKLSIISESIIANLYAEKSAMTSPTSTFQALPSLRDKLHHWRSSLPAHLNLQWSDMSSFDILPHTLSLMAMYHSLTILLFRPFVSDGHLRALDTSNASHSFTVCAAAATEIHSILRIYEKHFCLKTCPYFLSYATYASGTIHARVAAQRPADSQSQKMLRRCLEVLSQQQERFHAPRQSMRILLLLAQRLGVDVGTGLAAAASRTDVAEQCQAFVPTDPPPLTSGDSAMDTTEGSDGMDVLIEDFDIDAIIRSFDSDPLQPHSIDYGMNMQGHLGANYTTIYQRSQPNSEGMSHNTGEGYQAEGTAVTDFDTLFGFNAGFDLDLEGNV
ncbi:hypothetical protein Q7P37_009160 [Cladosporium fusiforme]